MTEVTYAGDAVLELELGSRDLSRLSRELLFLTSAPSRRRGGVT